MKLPWITPRYSIEDLKTKTAVEKTETTMVSLRSRVTIAIIDDNEFSPQSNLANNGFKFKHFFDLADLTQICDFPIVLCDIMGVGRSLNKDSQGAHLIREIKLNYPEKYIIAYSGGAHNSGLIKSAQDSSDDFIKKDADIDTWLSRLDGAIESVTDPIFVWRRFRDSLQKRIDIPAQDLVKLERAYVSACLGKNLQDPARFLRKELASIRNPLVTSFVESFVKSPVFTITIAVAKAYMRNE